MPSSGQAAWEDERLVDGSAEELRAWLPGAIETAFGVAPEEIEIGHWAASTSSAGKRYDLSVNLEPREGQQLVRFQVVGRRDPLTTAGVVGLASAAALSLAGVVVFSMRHWGDAGPAMGIPWALRPALLILPVLLVFLAMRAIRKTRLDVMDMVPRAERFAQMVDDFDAAPRVAGYRDRQRIAVPVDAEAEREAAELEAAELEAAALEAADERDVKRRG